MMAGTEAAGLASAGVGATNAVPPTNPSAPTLGKRGRGDIMTPS